MRVSAAVVSTLYERGAMTMIRKTNESGQRWTNMWKMTKKELTAYKMYAASVNFEDVANLLMKYGLVMPKPARRNHCNIPHVLVARYLDEHEELRDLFFSGKIHYYYILGLAEHEYMDLSRLNANNA